MNDATIEKRLTELQNLLKEHSNEDLASRLTVNSENLTDRFTVVSPLHGRVNKLPGLMKAARQDKHLLIGPFFNLGDGQLNAKQVKQANKEVIDWLTVELFRFNSVGLPSYSDLLIREYHPVDLFTEEDWLKAKALLSTEQMLQAYAIEDSLFTVGGLTYGKWVSLGKPNTAVEAARLLNGEDTIQAGVLSGEPVYYAASPSVASPFMETYPSWNASKETCPFLQFHCESQPWFMNSRLRYKDLTFASEPALTRYGHTVTLHNNTAFNGINDLGKKTDDGLVLVRLTFPGQADVTYSWQVI